MKSTEQKDFRRTVKGVPSSGLVQKEFIVKHGWCPSNKVIVVVPEDPINELKSFGVTKLDVLVVIF